MKTTLAIMLLLSIANLTWALDSHPNLGSHITLKNLAESTGVSGDAPDSQIPTAISYNMLRKACNYLNHITDNQANWNADIGAFQARHAMATVMVVSKCKGNNSQYGCTKTGQTNWPKYAISSNTGKANKWKQQYNTTWKHIHNNECRSVRGNWEWGTRCGQWFRAQVNAGDHRCKTGFYNMHIPSAGDSNAFNTCMANTKSQANHPSGSGRCGNNGGKQYMCNDREKPFCKKVSNVWTCHNQSNGQQNNNFTFSKWEEKEDECYDLAVEWFAINQYNSCMNNRKSYTEHPQTSGNNWKCKKHNNVHYYCSDPAKPNCNKNNKRCQSGTGNRATNWSRPKWLTYHTPCFNDASGHVVTGG